MAREALVFAGQGAQFPGMGKDLADAYPECRELFDRADEVLGYGLSSICFDGPDERRIGPVPGPILANGQSADIRFEVVGGRARVKIWPVGDDEPAGWDIESEPVSTDAGIVHISYRDGVAQSVAWNELTLQLWP